MKRNIFIILTYIAVYVLTSVYAGFIIAGQIAATGDYVESEVLLYAQIFMGVAGFALMVGIFRKYLLQQFKDFRNRLGNIILIGILGFMALFVVSIISGIIISYFTETATSVNQGGIQSMFEGLSTFQLIMLSLSIAVFTPIVEELTFRKGLYGIIGFLVMSVGIKINKEVDDAKDSKLFMIASISAIIGSSLIFGLLHVFAGGDYIYLINYASAGIVLGVIYHVSGRNIYASIITHIIQNTIGVIAILSVI